MFAIAILRYRRPLDEVLAALDDHRAYLRSLRERGILLVSGPFESRAGGALILRVPDDEPDRALDEIREGDPFWRRGIAHYELVLWKPTIGGEDLDRIVPS